MGKTADLARKDSEILLQHDVRLSMGRTWASVDAPTTDLLLSAATFNGSVFFGRGGSSNNLTRSTNKGTAWTSTALPFSASCTALAASDLAIVGLFASGTDAVVSTDGDTFTTQALNMTGVTSPLGFRDAAYGAGRFVAVGTSSIAANGVIFGAPANGIGWSMVHIDAALAVHAVAAGGGRFVAVGPAGAKRSVMSLDGITFVSTDLPNTFDWTAATYFNGMFIAFSSTSGKIARSSNGLNWIVEDFTARNWARCAVGNGVLVVVSSDGVVAVSFDGLTFRELPVRPIALRDITYMGGSFYLCTGSANASTAIFRSDA